MAIIGPQTACDGPEFGEKMAPFWGPDSGTYLGAAVRKTCKTGPISGPDFGPNLGAAKSHIFWHSFASVLHN